MTQSVVVLADGQGTRWGSHLGIPKHLVPLEDGTPLLFRTLRRLDRRLRHPRRLPPVDAPPQRGRMLAFLTRRLHPTPVSEPNRHTRRALAALDSQVGWRTKARREHLARERRHLRG